MFNIEALFLMIRFYMQILNNHNTKLVKYYNILLNSLKIV